MICNTLLLFYPLGPDKGDYHYTPYIRTVKEKLCKIARRKVAYLTPIPQQTPAGFERNRCQIRISPEKTTGGCLPIAEHGDEQRRFQYILSGPSTKGETSPPILTIQAKKADIDAYSADKIDYDQFRQRTAILTSHASPGRGQPQTGWWTSQSLRR
jgi:hypothetical protein